MSGDHGGIGLQAKAPERPTTTRSPREGTRACVAALVLALMMGAWLGVGVQPAWAQSNKSSETSKKSEKEKTGKGSQAVLDQLIKRPFAIQGRTATGRTIQDAPPFTVRSRLDDLEFFPCDDCHDAGKSDRRVRKLTEEHTEIEFQHGGGRFWCYDACHNASDMTKLQQMWGSAISFDEAYRLCGQCHFERQKDWYFGGHGKRVGAFAVPREIPLTSDKLLVTDRESIGTWRGERELLNCTACHNPHSPSIKPYDLAPPPKLRAGLEWREKPEEVHETIWERLIKQNLREK